MDLKRHIRGIPDFPKPGILFYDISPMLAHPRAWHYCTAKLSGLVADWEPDILVGIDSRGFLVAAPLALHIGCGFAMLRKEGKLPGKKISHSYELEYGSDTVEIHADAIEPGQRVVIVDDLMATGGTMAAGIELIRKVGGEVRGAACVVELTFLGGRKHIDVPFEVLLQYDD